MPFGFWVLGNKKSMAKGRRDKIMSQMPFGFWVLGNFLRRRQLKIQRSLSLKCLSAFGFWGTSEIHFNIQRITETSQMPFGFWVLGNPKSCKTGLLIMSMSQMPFGFWVLGNGQSS